MTAADLEELLSISREQIYKLARTGKMPSYGIAGMVRFDPGAVATWLESKRMQ